MIYNKKVGKGFGCLTGNKWELTGWVMGKWYTGFIFKRWIGLVCGFGGNGLWWVYGMDWIRFIYFGLLIKQSWIRFDLTRFSQGTNFKTWTNFANLIQGLIMKCALTFGEILTF